jgi:predicted alpha-1,2-mannosidase
MEAMRMRTLPALAVSLVLLGCNSSSQSSSPPDGGSDDGGPEDMSPTRPAEAPVQPPLVGTGGFGFSVGSQFPGASAPHGMAKPGPDTSGPWGTIDFLHCSGYWYDDDTIRGFSQTHMPGAGLPDYGVLAIMPVGAFDPAKTTSDSYASKFDKTAESSVPGKYAVTLSNGGIGVEITATTHAAHYRLSYPAAAGGAHVVVDLDHHLEGGSVDGEAITVDTAGGTVQGQLKSHGKLSGGNAGTYYFAAKVQPAWSTALVWSQGNAPAAGTQAQGTGVGADLAFNVATGQAATVEVQIGLSMVSTAAAAANLAAEMPAFAFDQEASSTGAAWQNAMSVVDAQGGTQVQQAMIQAAAYHLFLAPTVYADVDGHYFGFDGQVHQAQGFHYVSDLSLWDTYRTLVPLYDLVAQKDSLDTVQSLYAMAQQSGHFPKWSVATGDCGSMVGASAEVVVADAYVKGVQGFDAEGAYQILRAAAMDQADPPGGRGGRDQVAAYMQLGYVPGNVSVTSEYGQDDVALSNLAAALGHSDDASALSSRAHGWQKQWDPQTGFLWAKAADGTWATTHGDPTIATKEFVEANAWQSVWGPWYDIAGLESVMGGKDAFVAKLESFFEQGKQDYDAVDWTKPLSAGVPRKYYWGGNEPDIHAVYLFALAGRPDLTQKWVSWIENEVFTAAADGLPGNDDLGTMSAWLVESMLGFYAVPGTDQYVVGAPAFPHATIAVPGGTFAIDASGVSTSNVYVQGVTLNGAPLATPVLHQSDFKAGGSLAFVMGPTPSTWGQ